jgi:hypothetical protein
MHGLQIHTSYVKVNCKKNNQLPQMAMDYGLWTMDFPQMAIDHGPWTMDYSLKFVFLAKQHLNEQKSPSNKPLNSLHIILCIKPQGSGTRRYHQSAHLSLWQQHPRYPC